MQRNSHQVYELGYHIIFCTKYRHKILTGEVEIACRNAMAETISKVLYPADDHIQGKRLLGADCLGGLESAYLLGTPDRAGLPQGLELSGLDLQKLFILMTGNPEGAFSGTPRK